MHDFHSAPSAALHRQRGVGPCTSVCTRPARASQRMSKKNTLCVQFLDASAPHELAASGSIGTLRRRVAEARGLPADARVRLCLRGEEITDDGRGAGALEGETLTAWTPRYSAGLSSQLAERSERLRQERAAELAFASRPLWRKALDAARIRGPAALAAARRAPPGVWARAGAWLVLALLTVRLQLWPPFLIVSCVWLMWTYGLGERGVGEESAYTVFNNFRALPGQMGADEIQRQVARGL